MANKYLNIFDWSMYWAAKHTAKLPHKCNNFEVETVLVQVAAAISESDIIYACEI
jgi:hypothetical protein